MKKNKVLLSQSLLNEIATSLTAIDSHGSVEIFVQDCEVTQITIRNIKKTSTKPASNNHQVKKVLDKAISIY